MAFAILFLSESFVLVVMFSFLVWFGLESLCKSDSEFLTEEAFGVVASIISGAYHFSRFLIFDCIISKWIGDDIQRALFGFRFDSHFRFRLVCLSLPSSVATQATYQASGVCRHYFVYNVKIYSHFFLYTLASPTTTRDFLNSMPGKQSEKTFVQSPFPADRPP